MVAWLEGELERRGVRESLYSQGRVQGVGNLSIAKAIGGVGGRHPALGGLQQLMGAAEEDAGPPGMANGAAPAKGAGVGRMGSRLVRTTSEIKAEEILNDVDPWTAWMYKPQTSLVTLAGACVLVYVSYPALWIPRSPVS